MFRELSQIILSINLSTTTLPQVKVNSFANAIQDASVKNDIDPYTIVAIATHESNWRERAVSPDKEDYGLLQVRAKYNGGEKNKANLLTGEFNIRAGTFIAGKARDFCRTKLKREPSTEEWMSVYQGSLPSCVPTQLTKVVWDFEVCIKNNIEKNETVNCRKIYWPRYEK